MAYYTLNDLLLAKVIGEKDTSKEVVYFEELLMSFDGTGIKADSAAFLGAIEEVAVEGKRDSAVFGVRALFREQLTHL